MRWEARHKAGIFVISKPRMSQLANGDKLVKKGRTAVGPLNFHRVVIVVMGSMGCTSVIINGGVELAVINTLLGYV